VRQGTPQINKNIVEAYISALRRGMNSTYQRCAKKHLHGYLAESDFR
jgi:hypothetical protein